MPITNGPTVYCSHWLQITFLWPLKCFGLRPQQIMMDTDCKYPLCDISSVLGFSHNIWDVRERLFNLWLEADSVLSGCRTKGIITNYAEWNWWHYVLYLPNEYMITYSCIWWTDSVAFQMLWLPVTRNYIDHHSLIASL